MKYQIIPNDDTVQVTISDDGVTETLTLLEAPSEESILVQQGRKDVLGEINLEKMLANLDDCVDLLQITFNAVDGFAVQSKVQDLSTKFSNAMLKSNTAALDFKLATKTVVNAYIEAYGNLFYGETEVAISILTDIKPIAQKMVKKSDELVKTYDELTNYTNVILKEVMDERSADETKRNETKTLIAQLEASINAMNELKKNLVDDIKQFEEDYKKLEQREMEQEKRSYNMQLASLIISGIGSLFGTANDVYSDNKKKERDEAEHMTESEMGECSAETKAKRDYTQNICEQENIKSQLQKIDERIKAIDEVLDGQFYKDGENNENADKDNPDTQKTAQELRDEKVSLTNKKSSLNNDLNSLKGKEDTLSNTLKGFGAAMDKVSEEVHSAAQEMQKKADSLAERMEVIRKRRDELKDKERENVVKLAEYTAKMENAVMDANSLESAVQSLVVAIGCLRRVLAYLQEIKLFWMNVEAFCDRLANDDGIVKLIKHQEQKEPEKRAAYFKTILFVKGYIQTVSKWQTLNIIFSEYLEALAAVAKRLNESFEQALDSDRKVQWKLASKLAGQLKNKLKSEAAEMV